jgi:hypothetical protein
MMERIAAAFLATLVGIGMGGTAATAAQIEITYELQTTYTLVGVGELGPPSLGSMTVAFPAAGSAPASSTTEPGGTFGGAVIPHGPVHMSLLTFPPIIVNVTIAGDLISGVLNPTATTLASLPGSLMSNGALTLGPINIWDAGNLHCAGATCTALGFFSHDVQRFCDHRVTLRIQRECRDGRPGGGSALQHTGTTRGVVARSRVRGSQPKGLAPHPGLNS